MCPAVTVEANDRAPPVAIARKLGVNLNRKGWIEAVALERQHMHMVPYLGAPSGSYGAPRRAGEGESFGLI